MTYKSYNSGKLKLEFSNGDSQEILLEATLLRPLLTLNMSGFEGRVSPDTYDFGTVHVNNIGTIAFFLCNVSKVPAKWKLMNVKFTIKSKPGFATKTKLEWENDLKTDDPGVFEFSKSEVL